MRQHLILAMLAVGLALAAATLASGPVRAECPYIPPNPPVTKAIPSARTILVGTVLESAPGSYVAIRLRIDHVLRGPGKVGAVREFETLYANWPLTRLDDGTMLAPCESMSAEAGDVIAIALGALAPDGRTRYNAMSWIIGSPPYRDTWETTTLAELEMLADLPRTETADAAPAGSRVEPAIRAAWFLLVGLVGAIITAVSLDRHARRRAR